MILERAIFSIKPGSAKEFKATFALARPHIEGADGFSQLEIRQGIENPDSFLLLVWWDKVDSHMKGFRESQAFVEWRKHLGPFFAGPPAMEHYEETL
jgi:heme-degrading monooxygenase HmoA